MKIDVVDMDDPVLGTHRRNLARTSGSAVIGMYGMCNGIGQMVTNVLQVGRAGVLRYCVFGDMVGLVGN